MSRTKNILSGTSLLALVVGLGVGTNGCNEVSVAHVDTQDAGWAQGGAGAAMSTGGAATGGHAGAAAGGTTGSGGNISSGGVAHSGGNSTGGQPGAGGQIGTGGQISTGGQNATGGSGAGGSSSSVADAGPELVRDAAADHLAIPDLAVKTDAAPVFWPGTFAPNCTPPAIGGRAQTDGHHRAGEDCMRSGCHLNPKKPEHHAGTDCRGSGCHSNGSPDGSGAPAFLFGGTVYRAGSLAADPAVQVGVKATQGFYSACSASNGNFWVIAPTGTTTLTWTSATARIRNANGEAPMMTTPGAGCNASTCHTGTLKMTSP